MLGYLLLGVTDSPVIRAFTFHAIAGAISWQCQHVFRNSASEMTTDFEISFFYFLLLHLHLISTNDIQILNKTINEIDNFVYDSKNRKIGNANHKFYLRLSRDFFAFGNRRVELKSQLFVTTIDLTICSSNLTFKIIKREKIMIVIYY